MLLFFVIPNGMLLRLCVLILNDCLQTGIWHCWYRDDEGAGLLCLAVFGEFSGLWTRINPCSESKRGVYRRVCFVCVTWHRQFFNPKFSLLLLTQEAGTRWQYACMVHCDNLTHACRMQWPNQSALHFLLSLNTDHVLYLGPSSAFALTPLANTELEVRHIAVGPNWALNLTLKTKLMLSAGLLQAWASNSSLWSD